MFIFKLYFPIFLSNCLEQCVVIAASNLLSYKQAQLVSLHGGSRCPHFGAHCRMLCAEACGPRYPICPMDSVVTAKSHSHDKIWSPVLSCKSAVLFAAFCVDKNIGESSFSYRTVNLLVVHPRSGVVYK